MHAIIFYHIYQLIYVFKKGGETNHKAVMKSVSSLPVEKYLPEMFICLLQQKILEDCEISKLIINTRCR